MRRAARTTPRAGRRIAASRSATRTDPTTARAGRMGTHPLDSGLSVNKGMSDKIFHRPSGRCSVRTAQGGQDEDSAGGIVVAVGAAAFKPVTELTREDYTGAFVSKTLGQIEFVTQGLDHLSDGGSITFVTGVLSRDPVPTASAAAMANGAVESFVVSAAPELPRRIRINAVSPNVLANSPHFHDAFAGMIPVTDEEVASAFVRSIEGNVTGRILTV